MFFLKMLQIPWGISLIKVPLVYDGIFYWNVMTHFSTIIKQIPVTAMNRISKLKNIIFGFGVYFNFLIEKIPSYSITRYR